MALGFVVNDIYLNDIVWYINDMSNDSQSRSINITWNYHLDINNADFTPYNPLSFSIDIPSWITVEYDEDYYGNTNDTVNVKVDVRTNYINVTISSSQYTDGEVNLHFTFTLKNKTQNNYTSRFYIGSKYYTWRFNATYWTNGNVSFKPYTLDFGNVKINETNTKNVTITVSNTYTTSKYFSGSVSANNYDYAVFQISSNLVINGTKKNQFTYNSVTYTTYEVSLPIKFTPKYFGEQQYRIELSYYNCFNNNNTASIYSKLTVKANVQSQTDTTVVTGGDGKIYLGNVLLADSSNSLPIGAIIMFYGNTSNIPSGWALCDGKTHNGVTTPNLTDRFIIGCSINNPVGKSGGQINSTKDALLDKLNQNYFQKTNLSHYHRINFQETSWRFGDDANGRPVPQTATTPTWSGDYAIFNNVFTSYDWSNNSTSSGSRLSFGSDTPTKFPLPAFYALAFIMKIS